MTKTIETGAISSWEQVKNRKIREFLDPKFFERKALLKQEINNWNQIYIKQFIDGDKFIRYLVKRFNCSEEQASRLNTSLRPAIWQQAAQLEMDLYA